MTAVAIGISDWSFVRDQDGHREYEATFRVETDDPTDGPLQILGASGLPSTGSYWSYGGDSDPWALCWPTVRVTPVVRGERTKYWNVVKRFSTKPLRRCQDTSIDNPINEPYRIGGTFVKYTEEAYFDRFGNPIKSSSHEPIRGPQVEFDANRPTVWIEQNTLTLGLDTFSALLDNVNDSPLWGLGPRKIKFSNISWERKLYGTCTYYFTRRLEFDVSYQGFDRRVIDEGYMVLRGKWVGDDPDTAVWVPDPTADKNNPADFIRYKDKNSENCKVLLDGNGNPLGATGTGTGATPVEIKVEKYPETNLLVLDIPSSLE